MISFCFREDRKCSYKGSSQNTTENPQIRKEGRSLFFVRFQQTTVLFFQDVSDVQDGRPIALQIRAQCSFTPKRLKQLVVAVRMCDNKSNIQPPLCDI